MENITNTNLNLPVQVNAIVYLDILSLENAEQLFKLVKNNATYLRQWLPWVDDIQKKCDQEILFV